MSLSHLLGKNKLELDFSMPIIEDDSLVLGSITYIELSNDLKRLLITDIKGNQVVICNIYDGKIIKVFHEFSNYSDSMAIYKNYNNRPGEYFCSFKEAIDSFRFYKSYSEAKQKLKWQVKQAKWLQDTVVISISTRCFGLNYRNDTIRQVFTDNQYSLIWFYGDDFLKDKFKLLNQPFRGNNNCFFRPDPYEFINSNLMVGRFESSVNLINNNQDSIWSIGLLNLEENKVVPKMNQPEDYLKSKLGYNLSGVNLVLDDEKNLFVSYSLLPYIFRLNDNKRYIIENLANGNSKVIDSLCRQNSNLTNNKSTGIYESIFPFAIRNFFYDSKKYFYIIWRELDNYGKLSEVKFGTYNTDFKCLSIVDLTYLTENGHISAITFSKYDNKLLIVRKNINTGYLIESYRILDEND